MERDSISLTATGLTEIRALRIRCTLGIPTKSTALGTLGNNSIIVRSIMIGRITIEMIDDRLILRQHRQKTATTSIQRVSIRSTRAQKMALEAQTVQSARAAKPPRAQPRKEKLCNEPVSIKSSTKSAKIVLSS